MESKIKQSIGNPSWYLAMFGIALMQWWGLIHLWSTMHRALLVASLLSCWLVGNLYGQASGSKAFCVWVWGAFLFLLSDIWIVVAQVNRALPESFPYLSWFGYCLLACILGACSSAWIGHRDNRAFLREGTRQVAEVFLALPAVTLLFFGPASWLPALGICLSSPLLVLDIEYSARPHLSPPQHRGEQASFEPPGLRTIIGYLSRQKQWYLTILASVSSLIVVITSGGILVPFAAASTAGTLLWLCGGQSAACVLAALLLYWQRNLLGPAHRQFPTRSIRTLYTGALLALLGVPFSFVLLSRLTGPVWLALSIGLFTMSSLIWKRLWPRLRRSTLNSRGTGNPGHRAVLLALDETVLAEVGRIEMIAASLLLPVVGYMVERLGVASILLIGAMCLLLLFVLASCSVLALRWFHTEDLSAKRRRYM